MRVPIQLPPGLIGDDTSAVATGRYYDADKTRFWRGQPQTIGGWERLTTTALTGVCRGLFVWTDNDGAITIAFGTHSALQVWRDGDLATITPYRPPEALTGPFAMTNGSAVVTVTHNSHGMATANQVTFSGASAAGGITISGTYSITYVSANSYTITHVSAATSTTTGGGTVTAQVLLDLLSGNIDGTGGTGYGTGTYSTGTYSAPSTTEYYPRTWSLAAWGENLLASPRGGTIYKWANVMATRAAIVTAAPDTIQYMLVTPQRQVLALGCNEEVSGIYNPLCIRWCDIEDLDDWTTSPANNAGEYILAGGGRIVAGRVTAYGTFIWTDNALYQATYLGDPGQTYQFDQIGKNCGLIGPNAAVVVGQTAFWLAPDGQFYSCTLGGAPQPMVSPIGVELFSHLTAAQKDKVYASSTSSFAEIRWDYPDDRDGVENSRYVAVNTLDGAWTRGEMVRTAMTDSGPGPYPVGVSYAGAVYWHERGQSDDGAAFAASIETADQSISEDELMMIQTCWPDFKDQVGAVSLEIITRMYPQGEETTHGPWSMIPGKTKVDLRATGRIARLRLSSNSGPTYWRLGKPSFEVTPAGQR